MSHKDTLRRNHVYLRDHLNVIGLLDHLFQEGVFTDAEIEACRAGDTRYKQCNTLLDILRRKDVEDYRTFCAILHHIQPNVKRHLDKDDGQETALYVSKNTIESKYKTLIDSKDKQIARLERELEERNSDITHLCGDHKMEMDNYASQAKLALDRAVEEKEQIIADVQQRIHSVESQKLNVEKALEGSVALQRELQSRIELLEKELADCTEKYAAITKSFRPEQCINAENANHTDWDRDTCVACRLRCGENHVTYRLPCIHVMCQTCFEQFHDTSGICSECSRVFDRTGVKPDKSIRNKARWEKKETRGTCTHNIHHEDREAASFCEGCDDYLCLECINNHDQIRSCSGHAMYPMDEIQTSPYQHFRKKETCPSHEEYDLVLYDQDCKMAICLVCIQDGHKNHETVELKKEYDQEKKGLEVLLECLQARSDEIQRIFLDLKDQGLVLDRREASLCNQISAARENLSLQLLRRGSQLQDEVIQSLEAPRMVLQENRCRLLKTYNSVSTAIEFGNQILHFCSKSEFLQLKQIVHDRSRDDLTMPLPSSDRRGNEVWLLLDGQNNLERAVQSLFALYSPMKMDAEPLSDATPTVEDFLRRIHLLEEEIQENKLAIASLTSTFSQMKKDIGFARRELDLKAKQLQSAENVSSLKDKKLENLPFLEQRCSDLEDKLIRETNLKKDLLCQAEKETASLNETIDVFRKRCGHLEQALERKVVCVGSHRNSLDNILIVCPRFRMCSHRVNTQWCRVEDGELTNLPSDTKDEEPSQVRFRKFGGTSGSEPLHPAPCQIHHEPVYWEVEADITGLDEEFIKSRKREPVLETGVVEETALDKHALVSTGELSWCIVLCLCRKHDWVCKQIWKHGQHVKCVTISKRETVLRFGGVFDAVKSKLTFLDISKNEVLRVFDLEHMSPLWLTFGVSTETPFAVRLKLISGADVEMNARKKCLILRAVT
ncbi:putative leucine-rich repeat-containing protein DDB_G0290503 [Haliotis asinina]|uniref:putative leucine-rich repeat-containing protein DDB_G0290503 n=1 Tax=Haliotis asinina TaxID=109174 RepID=UPI0035322DBF